MKSLIFFTFCIVSSCSSAAQQLRVVTEDLPPYQIVTNGKLIGGSSFLIVSELLKQAEIKAKIEVLPWARAYTIATSDSNVLIFSIARTKSRESLFHWLVKLDNLKYSFYHSVAQPHLSLNSLDELKNHTVSAVRNSVEANLLMDMGFMEGKNLILTLGYKEAWEMVALNRADYTYATAIFAEPILQASEQQSTVFIKSHSYGQSLELFLAASINTEQSILDKLMEVARLHRKNTAPIARHRVE